MRALECLLAVFALIPAIQGDERPAVRACAEFEQVIRERSPEFHFPYMAAISWNSWKDGNETKIKCAGTLIHKKFVLTGARCVQKAKFVLLGVKTLDKPNADDFVEVPIKDIHVHPEYSKAERYSKHSIAVLELDHEVEFNKFIFPICLHVDNEIPADDLEVISWTRRSLASNIERHKVKIEPFHSCNSTYIKNGYGNVIHEGHVCVVPAENDIGLCDALSGAPLMSPINVEKQIYREIGFISIGSTKCGTEIPDALVQISNYIEFIESIVWPENV